MSRLLLFMLISGWLGGNCFTVTAFAEEQPPPPLSTPPEPVRLEESVRSFLEQALREQKTFGDIEIQPLNAQTLCRNPQPFLPAHQTRLLGRFTVGVHCEKAPTRYISVRVSVKSEYLVTTRAIAMGEILSSDMVEIRQGALESLPRNTLTDPKTIIGLQTTRALTADAPLLSTQLRDRPAVQKGARVTIEVMGAGFRIRSEGTALEDGSIDSEIRIRNDKGETLRARVVAPNHLQLLQ